MSVRDRLEDGQVLWDHGRKEGAFVLVLIAAAATARTRYPLPMADSRAFKSFVADEMGTITGGPKYNVAFPFMGEEKVRLVDILYHHLRCQLVHEGEMPETIEFTQPEVKGGQTYNVLRLRDPLGFPEGWVLNLARAVREAPENADVFQAAD